MEWEVTFKMMIDDGVCLEDLRKLEKASQIVEDRLTKSWVPALQGVSHVKVVRFLRGDYVRPLDDGMDDDLEDEPIERE